MKKIIYFFVFAFFCFFNIKNTHALTASWEKIDLIYKVHNTNGNFSYSGDSWYKLYIDDMYTYCVAPGTLFKVGDNYYEGTYDKIDNDLLYKMELISYYGYQYKNHTSVEYYLATQEMIHNLFGYTPTYNDGNFNVNSYKQEINDLVLNHNVLPTIEDSINLVVGNNYQYIDNNNVLEHFDIEVSSNLEVNIDGSVINIRLLDDNKGYIKFYKGVNDKTKFYFNEGYQTVASLKLSKELMKTVEILPKESGRVEVTDQNRATFEGIEGTKYSLLDQYFQEIETKITDSNGYLIFDNNYEYGRYYVQEIEVKDYPRNEYLIIVDLDSNIFTAPFFHGNLGSIDVINVDEEGNKLNGKFEISSYDYYGMGFDDLIVGTYYIKQTEVQSGYIIDDQIYEVKITKENLNKELIVVNKKIEGSLEVSIEDEFGNKLEGKYEITDIDGKSVDRFYLGTYYVKQTEVEYGYVIDDTVYEVKITEETLDQKVTIINERLIGSIEVNIVDEFSNKLEGKYDVTNVNRKNMDKFYLGTYYVKQTEVEYGYVIDDTVYEVEITEEDLNQKVTIVNKRLVGSLEVSIEDEDGNNLDGKYEVLDVNGKNSDEFYLGTYYVKQTEAQSGYIIDDTVYEVKITEDNLNQKVVILNNKIMEVPTQKIPQTGSNVGIWFIISLILFVVGKRLKRIDL